MKNLFTAILAILLACCLATSVANAAIVPDPTPTSTESAVQGSSPLIPKLLVAGETVCIAIPEKFSQGQKEISLILLDKEGNDLGLLFGEYLTDSLFLWKAGNVLATEVRTFLSGEFRIKTATTEHTTYSNFFSIEEEAIQFYGDIAFCTHYDHALKEAVFQTHLLDIGAPLDLRTREFYFFPLRFICEKSGLEVNWNKETRRVTVSNTEGTSTLTFPPDYFPILNNRALISAKDLNWLNGLGVSFTPYGNSLAVRKRG